MKISKPYELLIKCRSFVKMYKRNLRQRGRAGKRGERCLNKNSFNMKMMIKGAGDANDNNLIDI